MTNWGIIDLILGLFFIYFILSVICTSLVEVFAQMRNLRSHNLNKWIRDAFNTKDGGTIGSQIIKHKLVDGLTMDGKSASFIPAKIFSSALLDLIHQNYQSSKGVPDNITPFNCDSIKEALKSPDTKVPNELKRYMLQAIEDCNTPAKSIDQLKERIEHWYEDAMERLSGTYKKKIRYITLIFAVIITISINANTITIARYLKDNPKIAEQLANAAENAAKDSALYKQTIIKIDSINNKLSRKVDSTSTSSFNETVALIKANKQQSDSLIKTLQSSGLPLGWTATTTTTQSTADQGGKNGWAFLRELITNLAGWMATICAITLGAPFWFDMINKVVNIRSVGKSPASVK